MNQQETPKPHKTQKEQLNSYAHLSGIAIQMFAIIAVGTYAGVKLDEKYPNKNNGYTLAFTLTSVIASIVYVIRRIIATSKKE